MDIRVINEEVIRVENIADFSVKQTLECGQCFRWKKIDKDTYKGIAYEKPLVLKQIDNNTVEFYTSLEDFNNIWIKYFDLERNYKSVKDKVKNDQFLVRATDYGWGIRILKQDIWETICSFIISQQNNIPKITKTIENMCRLYGREVNHNGLLSYTFPSARDIVEKAETGGLLSLGLGYRAKYVYSAALQITNGTFKLDGLNKNRQTALTALTSLYGVGPKVANCILLFALGYTNSFPIDVWIQRVIDEVYDGKFETDGFEDCCGIIQQYMFYYIRFLI